MARSALNIVIGGEAGQGLVTVGLLLSRSLVRHGYRIVVTQGYQSRIRGGHNTFAIRADAGEIASGQESIDVLVALTEQTIALHRNDLADDGFVVSDAAYAVDIPNAMKVPYKSIATARYENVAALGVVSALIGLDEKLIARLLQETFGKKGDEVVAENQAALGKAYEWARAQEAACRKLPPVEKRTDRLMMNGNEAIVMGALSAGVKFYAFYPMTPSTSVSLGLAAQAKRMGLVVEQAEDEIAAINMAIGASYAGAPSMVATSGGGFALMVEGVSLAAMLETPIVIVDAQRPAPATGLPTRTEQADLEFVLHAGHGEFPRAIYAPGTVEECFHLTAEAFHLAEAAQGPVFLLTDQFLADSYRAVEPFDVEKVQPIRPVDACREYKGADYKRYALTDSGVSPRLLPGATEHLVVVDSDEHADDGHLTEDLGMRMDMQRKRMKKADIIRERVVAPTHAGEEAPDLLLVSWGSTKGAVDEAAAVLASKGAKVATLHFSQVWPLKKEQFMSCLENAKAVVAVEGNATGQFAKLIRRETGFHIEKTVLRYDGLPITPEFIVRELG